MDDGVLTLGRKPDPAMSDAEWRTRIDLAACYQLADLYGMSGMAGTHISARVPGPDHHFLLNPFGMFFEEITASSLVKVDMDGNILAPRNAPPFNPAGFVIHSAIHMSQPHLAFAMHTHTIANNAVAMQKDGLLPLSQSSIGIMSYLRYHDFEGAELELSERERLVRDLGDGRIVILRNHGALTVGESVGEAFVWMYRLETCCRQQVAGLSGGREMQWLSEETVRHAAQQGRKVLGKGGFLEAGKLEWPALIRKLERERGVAYAT